MSISEKVERNLILHCAPTLASLKAASLFTLGYSRRDELCEALRVWNRNLSDKGVAMTALRENDERALIYVFRKTHLKKALGSPRIINFLQSGGYSGADIRNIGSAIRALRQHLAALSDTGGFPHEIGVFLGYPLDDVIGFIENKGQNCKHTGCWKVYCNEREAVKTFALYKKCEALYMSLWEQGRSVRQLTVSA